MYTAGFIGIGNMGGALMTAAAKMLDSDFMVCDFDNKKIADAVEKMAEMDGKLHDTRAAISEERKTVLEHWLSHFLTSELGKGLDLWRPQFPHL